MKFNLKLDCAYFFSIPVTYGIANINYAIGEMSVLGIASNTDSCTKVVTKELRREDEVIG